MLCATVYNTCGTTLKTYNDAMLIFKGAISFKEDFLFVYSTTAHYIVGFHEADGSPFIQSLVEVLDERLNEIS